VPDNIQVILGTSGNDRVHALLAEKDDLASLNDRLGNLEQRLNSRMPSLELARSLASSAAGLEPASAARERLEALAASRDLLADADPVGPIVKDLADALRDAIHQGAVALRDARVNAVKSLGREPAWRALNDAQRESLLTEYHLATEVEPNLNDAAAVLMAAQARPLQGWAAELDAILQRASRALEAAIRLSTPAAKTTTVRVSTASLSSTDEVERYIEALRLQLLDALSSGNDTVVVKG